jgi:hypothetical protein
MRKTRSSPCKLPGPLWGGESDVNEDCAFLAVDWRSIRETKDRVKFFPCARAFRASESLRIRCSRFSEEEWSSADSASAV